jgi:hypothetical protein
LAEKHALFRAAHHALDLPGAGADEEAMSEGQLRARVAAHDRELAWAPPYVADQLEATHTAWRKADTDATLVAARADTAADPAEAEQLRTAAHAARAEAERLVAQVAQLDAADQARAAWWVETAVTRDNAHRSREALAIRGIDLDTPADRVTAEEWLDAHRADQAATDPDRQITDEHDLTDHPASQPQAEQQAGREPPERLPDTQSAAEPDDQIAPADESTQTGHEPDRRRIPPPDQTADTVERAHHTLAVIAARRHHEAVAAAELDPDTDEDTRRAELARWAADHNRAEVDVDERTDGRGHGRERPRGARGDADELVRE